MTDNSEQPCPMCERAILVGFMACKNHRVFAQPTPQAEASEPNFAQELHEKTGSKSWGGAYVRRPLDKAREWWLWADKSGGIKAVLTPEDAELAINENFHENKIHVIEYSAYDQLKRELPIVNHQEGILLYRGETYFQAPDELQREVEAAQYQRDENVKELRANKFELTQAKLEIEALKARLK